MEGRPGTAIRYDRAKVPTDWGRGRGEGISSAYVTSGLCACVRLCMCVHIRTILVESHPDLVNLKHQHNT